MVSLGESVGWYLQWQDHLHIKHYCWWVNLMGCDLSTAQEEGGAVRMRRRSPHHMRLDHNCVNRPEKAREAAEVEQIVLHNKT